MTRPLFERFPDLHLPWFPLGNFPTRIHRLDRLSKHLGTDIWIKRDDESHPRVGGSKIRKLEFYLPQAREEKRPIVGYGPAGSNWLLALAVFAKEFQISFWCLTFPQLMNDHARINATLLPQVTRVGTSRGFGELAARLLAARLRGNRLAPMGGSSPTTVLGGANAILELDDQIKRGECPRPHTIVVPLGSCGTAAGLALGCLVAWMQTQIFAVQVTSGLIANGSRTSYLARAAGELLGIRSPIPPVTVIRNLYTTYGESIPKGMEAMTLFRELEGIFLDTTYTAKAAAALIEFCRSGAGRGKPILFWHTYHRPVFNRDDHPRITSSLSR